MIVDFVELVLKSAGKEPWQTDKSYVKGYTRFAMDRVRTSEVTARFGVEFEDISTMQECEYWIAAGSLRVIDLASKQKIGERISYMVDLAQGDKSGGARLGCLRLTMLVLNLIEIFMFQIWSEPKCSPTRCFSLSASWKRS